MAENTEIGKGHGRTTEKNFVISVFHIVQDYIKGDVRICMQKCSRSLHLGFYFPSHDDPIARTISDMLLRPFSQHMQPSSINMREGR